MTGCWRRRRAHEKPFVMNWIRDPLVTNRNEVDVIEAWKNVPINTTSSWGSLIDTNFLVSCLNAHFVKVFPNSVEEGQIQVPSRVHSWQYLQKSNLKWLKNTLFKEGKRSWTVSMGSDIAIDYRCRDREDYEKWRVKSLYNNQFTHYTSIMTLTQCHSRE